MSQADRAPPATISPSLISDHQRWLFTERRFHLNSSLDTERDQARFLHWWIYRLRIEYQAGPEAVDWEHLASPAPGLHGPFSSHITVAMRMWWLLRDDLQKAFDLTTPEGRAKYASWFYRFGLFQVALDGAPYLDVVLPSLAEPCSADESPHPINRFAAAALSCFSKQLVDMLNSADLESVEQLFGAPLQQVAPELLYVYRLLPHGILAAPPPSTRTESTRPIRPHGANLIGYAHGAFGMAEHVRMTARALSCRTDDFSIVNVETYVHARQPERDVVEWVARKERYRTNIFHVNADAMASAVTVLGPRSFEGAYNIGYWAWELSNVPPDWRASIDFVDEIWAPSRFIQDAFQAATSKPVVYMPLCVDLSFGSWKRRRHFGLPEDSYLFLYYFDSYSYYQRKNPYAALRAFKA
ncbi:MAG TPA: hypothetical protein VJP88_04970, partial [Caulobacteraceae bacterium]|nr:hypothetical protein [Caulobacteraceae bacterium]